MVSRSLLQDDRDTSALANTGVVSVDIEPTVGASEPCDEAVAEVDRIEGELEDLLPKLKRQIKYVSMPLIHRTNG